jgi:chromosome segregation ATPase
MTPLLKNLLGNGSKDREHADEMRTLLHEMQQERSRYEALIERVRASAERLQDLGGPIAKAGSDIDAVAARLGELEQRFAAIAQLSAQYQTLDERAEGLEQGRQRAEAEIADTLEDVQRIRSGFEEVRNKVDAALGLKDQLEAFLEIDKPFQVLHGEAEALRGQVDGTSEHLARLREQQDRLRDAHNLANSKMEALDRRRDDLGRSLQDKERRLANVDQAVRGMDGIQHTVDDVRREIGTLKALGDSVVQKTAALEAQRDTVERALAQAANLERAMRQIDAGVHQQQENEKTLATLQDHAAALRSLHEAVLERSAEISQVQRETDEQTRATRQDLSAVSDEMKKTVARFDFESRGMESVSQRVADLRGALSDCENRFKGLSEPSLAVGELRSKTQALTSQLQTLSEGVGRVGQDMERFLAIRSDLDETGRTARELVEQMAQIQEARPLVEATLRDLEGLGAADTLVKDALEQAQLAHGEIVRLRESQSETRSWLTGVEQSVGELKQQVGDLHAMAPTIAVVQEQAQRLEASMTAIESRREFVEDLQRGMADLGALSGRLDERGRQLQARMEGAEQRFVGLAAHAEEAERLSTTVAAVSSTVNEVEQKTDEIGKAVAAIGARCESVEELADRTRALKAELEQRQHALTEASKDLQRASAARKDAAASAQQLDELAKRLTTALSAAERRLGRLGELSTQIEDRAIGLRSVEKQLSQFEERLAKWEPVEKEVTRSLEQIAARQGTVESLQADLDRMFAMAEKTATEVREITSAHQEIEQSRRLLKEVMDRLQQMRDTADGLDERRRQMTKAEERLARADALLVDVRSSLEALQGEKAIVDQAVEKAGSLQFLLKQAEATIEGLRQEREMTARVRAAVAVGRRADDADDDEEVARAA